MREITIESKDVRRFNHSAWGEVRYVVHAGECLVYRYDVLQLCGFTGYASSQQIKIIGKENMVKAQRKNDDRGLQPILLTAAGVKNYGEGRSNAMRRKLATNWLLGEMDKVMWKE